VEECGEQSKDGEDVDLGYAEELGRVKVIPVSELMR